MRVSCLEMHFVRSNWYTAFIKCFDFSIKIYELIYDTLENSFIKFGSERLFNQHFQSEFFEQMTAIFLTLFLSIYPTYNMPKCRRNHGGLRGADPHSLISKIIEANNSSLKGLETTLLPPTDLTTALGL